MELELRPQAGVECAVSMMYYRRSCMWKVKHVQSQLEIPVSLYTKLSTLT